MEGWGMVEPISEFGGKKEQLTFDFPLMAPVSSRIRYYELEIILCVKRDGLKLDSLTRYDNIQRQSISVWCQIGHAITDFKRGS